MHDCIFLSLQDKEASFSLSCCCLDFINGFEQPMFVAVWERHCAASCAPFLVEQKTSADFPFECCMRISVANDSMLDMKENYQGKKDRLSNSWNLEELCPYQKWNFGGAVWYNMIKQNKNHQGKGNQLPI